MARDVGQVTSIPPITGMYKSIKNVDTISDTNFDLLLRLNSCLNILMVKCLQKVVIEFPAGF